MKLMDINKIKKNGKKAIAETLAEIEKNPFDTVGCGDAFLSYAAPGVLISKSSVVGSILGTISSSIATRIEGNRPISHKEVKKKILEIKDICKVL